MNTVDESRVDSFVGDSSYDGGTVVYPKCNSCRYKLTIHTCSKYTKGMPSFIVLGLIKCGSYEKAKVNFKI
jgi:hypothetical protein